ncbi:hypothetical protein BDV38DRAFT_164298 [Aspergillus pseudotamarii]|uniref:Uncharacterized protein n=1 Tax=Aspergillus pseudotamarii TaxID=132259 RepID=A0A5N6SKR2_ASPPS|nr:uncharacterized protein BDV38DRAFT_164298 [Aspergillus pseudotamarii]KAE8134350.1 hypothetical protein BDV38DRAFT_164298 [Aspergillus pseudotamarii]
MSSFSLLLVHPTLLSYYFNLFFLFCFVLFCFASRSFEINCNSCAVQVVGSRIQWDSRDLNNSSRITETTTSNSSELHARNIQIPPTGDEHFLPDSCIRKFHSSLIGYPRLCHSVCSMIPRFR